MIGQSIARPPRRTRHLQRLAQFAAVLACTASIAGCGGNGSDSQNTNSQGEVEEFDEIKALIEINATDGDAGFHVLFDADAWKDARIDDPDGNLIFDEMAMGALVDQGLTENFFESSEPLCTEDPDEPDEEVVPLADFLARFPAGEYTFSGTTRDDGRLEGTAELTYNLPAAPEITSFDGTTVMWMPGTDLGECDDPALVADGVIADPATVEIVGWEVVVEPADEEAADPLRVYSVQMPPTAMMVTVPADFISAYTDDGFTEFKVEVGAIEESGNQTFAEEEFDL